MRDAGVTKRMTTEELEAFSDREAAAIVDMPFERLELKVPSRFQILSEIGRGGMGIVYKARDLETSEIVALKVLKPEIASDQTMRENLRREVCLARKVTHKNVCRIYEFYRTDTSACISMEFIDGESLLTKVHRVGALPISQCVDIARQVCAGLREAHAYGIIHRDLKPGNIMLSGTGVAKIMDFGVARQSQEKNQLTRTISGTPEYMAPEQIELKAIGPRTDVYALGLLLYEMVTGRQAFTGDTSISVILKQVREMPPPPSQLLPGSPSRMDALVLKCLRKNPESRFGSVDELDSALAQVVATANTSSVRSAELLRILRSASAAFPLMRSMRSLRDMRSVASVANEILKDKYERFARWMRARDSRKWFNTLPSQVAMALGLLVLAFAAVSLVNGNERHQNNATHAVTPAPAAPANDSLPPAAGVPISAIDPANQFIGGVEFADDQGTTSANNPSSEAPDDIRTADADLETPPIVEPTKPAKRPVRVPVRTAAKTIAPVAPALVPASLKLNAPAPLPIAVQAAPSGSLLPTGNAGANAGIAAEKTKADDSADLVETYLEVGSFKDPKWADDAVNHLAQLGFHAIAVHKGALWLQSYHVQVGPYVSSKKMGADQKKLEDQGFKPHSVK
jgi:serine/threonine protein kinase